MGRIANKRDVLAGLMFVGIGLGALAVATGYRMGTPVRMGAGFFPVLLSGLLVFLGVVVAWGGLRSGEAAAPRLAWRPLLVIAGSVALFAVMLDRAGLVLTTAAIVALSRAGRAGHPWRETLLLAGGAALILGLAVSVAGLLLLIDMIGAFAFVHAGAGLFVEQGGYELVLALGAAALLLAVVGAGRFSLDHLLLAGHRTAQPVGA